MLGPEQCNTPPSTSTQFLYWSSNPPPVFRFRWDHGGGALVIELVSLEEEEVTELFLSAMWGHSKKAAICESGSKSSPQPKCAATLISDSASRTGRNQATGLWYFVMVTIISITIYTTKISMNRNKTITNISYFFIQNCKPPSLWYFIMVAQANKTIHQIIFLRYLVYILNDRILVPFGR